jgi:phosphoserine aminotransferase
LSHRSPYEHVDACAYTHVTFFPLLQVWIDLTPLKQGIAEEAGKQPLPMPTSPARATPPTHDAALVQRTRTINLGAGPSQLPTSVLETASRGLLNYANTGMGLTELSHRSSTFQSLLSKAEEDLRALIALPDNFKIVFMQGGGSAQFSAVYLNLAARFGNKKADYFVTGSWSDAAVTEARRLGADVNVVADGRSASADGKTFGGVPPAGDWNWGEDPAYIYYCSNETVHGVRIQPPQPPPRLKNVPIVADMSSDILSEPIDWASNNFGIVYAGAQKNVGPSGLTIVFVREDLIHPADSTIPRILSYKTHADAGSLFNTPPMFSMYVSALVFEELRAKGGVEAKARENAEKARKVYEALDQSGGFYIPKVAKPWRSKMNVVFVIAGGKEVEVRFISEAGERGIKQIKGHRCVMDVVCCLCGEFADGFFL